MLESHFASSVWVLALVQGLAVLTALIARRGAGTGFQTIFQLLSLVSMTAVGLVSVLTAGSQPVPCLIFGTLFACMVVTATYDRHGLRPQIGQFV